MISNCNLYSIRICELSIERGTISDYEDVIGSVIALVTIDISIFGYER